MRSLHTRILLGTAAATALVLCAAGLLLDVLLRQTLSRQFDQTLETSARALAALAELSKEGWEFEAAARPGAPRGGVSADEHYQVWRPDGSTLARSPALTTDLPYTANPTDEPRFVDLHLPNGQAGRLIALTLAARVDDEMLAVGPPPRVTIAVARATAGLAAALARIRWTLLAVGAATLLVSGWALTLVVRRSLAPVRQLGQQIAALDATDLATRIDAGATPAELSPIVVRLNELLARLQAAFERERRFTGDVAHELRTPLAGLRATLELALARERDASAYRAALSNAMHSALELQQLVENLLHLARADAGQLRPSAAPVPLATLLRESWAAFEASAAQRGLRVVWQADPAAKIQTDAALLALVVRNLMDNVVCHADAGSEVAIRLAGDASAARLSIRNRAGRVNRADLPQMFKRFWRADATYPTSTGHHGLGLPLCRAIVELLGGTLTADLPEAETFEIRLTLPADAPTTPRRI